MTEEDNSSRNESVKVFVRIRPRRDGEDVDTVTVTNANVISISKENRSKEKKLFTFAGVFDEKTSQVSVYQAVAAPIVGRALGGYNGTIFAYGQSGTGKTYTMFGDLSKSHLKGIIPNVFAHIFTRLSLTDYETSSVVTVTFLEIYNEEIRDLLNSTGKKLDVRESKDLGVYVKDLTGYTVESMEKVLEIIDAGNKNRSTGSTKLNDRSSRSHAVFSILIETKTINGTTSFGKLNLVDLAGSERVHKSLATGDRLREAGKINMSLSVLSNVISALVDGKTSYVPYRNSKLTRLLQDSLGGNCLTAMIATVSPSAGNFEETYYTLMYADRVKHVTNYVVRNEKNDSVLTQLERKIDELRSKLKSITRRANQKKSIRQMLELEQRKEALLDQMLNIQKKILVGGENLMEKAHLQLELLEDTSKELEHLDSSHQLLRQMLTNTGDQIKAMTKQRHSLEEEDKRLDRELEEAERVAERAERLLLDKESEYQNEIGSLLYTNECLAKDMCLVKCVIDNCIGKEYWEKLSRNVVWDEDSGDWKVKFVASSGNNLKKRHQTTVKMVNRAKTKNVYRLYENEF